MIHDRESKLKFYSLGIVTQDKVRLSNEIKVYPIEDLPMVDGKVSDFKPEFKNTLPDAKGISNSTSAQASAVLTAIWLPLGQSNRVTPPDVIKNETVLIFRYADTDEYRWTTIAHEPNIRRKETVRYAFGNLSSPLTEWDESSSYWFEVSTHDKHVKFVTTKSDGEPYAYEVKIDTAAGSITMKDDVGNYTVIDSKRGTIQHKANTIIILDSPNTVVTGRLEVQKDTTLDQNLTVLANTSIKGSLSVSKGTSMGGGGTVSGNMSVSGTMTASNCNCP